MAYTPRQTIVRATLALAMACAAQGSFAVQSGQAAPAFTLAKKGGGQLSLAEFKGQVVYLDFWASWCGPCKQSFPWMNEIDKKWSGKGLKVLAVNLDEKTADAEKFLSETPAQFSIAFDPKGETAGTYGIPGMPTSMLIGADGKVIFVHPGFRAEERKELESKIEAAVKQANASSSNAGGK